MNKKSAKKKKISYKRIKPKGKFITQRRNLFDVKRDLIKKLGAKKLAELVGKSARALRSYNRYFIGIELGKHDRIPPKEVIKKIIQVARENKVKTLTRTYYKESEVFGNLIDKNTITKVGEQRKKFGKEFWRILVRFGLKIYLKGGRVIIKYFSIIVRHENDILTEIHDFINDMLQLDSVLRIVLIDVSIDVFKYKR